MSVMESVAETNLGLEAAGLGHNSIAADHLRSFIERLERLEEEKASIQTDIKEVFAEAKGSGFDTRVIRKILSERKQEHAARKEFEALLDLYKHSLGMV